MDTSRIYIPETAEEKTKKAIKKRIVDTVTIMSEIAKEAEIEGYTPEVGAAMFSLIYTSLD